MMAITRYEPWNLISQLHKELERNMVEGSTATAEWAPSVDIKEDKDKFVIHADIPGVKPEDIDVSMENGILTIKGEKKTEAETEREDYKRMERTYGSFYRRFNLPDTANSDAISAQTKHGVLELTIPKKAEVQPKKISVMSAD